MFSVKKAAAALLFSLVLTACPTEDQEIASCLQTFQKFAQTEGAWVIENPQEGCSGKIELQGPGELQFAALRASVNNEGQALILQKASPDRDRYEMIQCYEKDGAFKAAWAFHQGWGFRNLTIHLTAQKDSNGKPEAIRMRLTQHIEEFSADGDIGPTKVCVASK